MSALFPLFPQDMHWSYNGVATHLQRRDTCRPIPMLRERCQLQPHVWQLHPAPPRSLLSRNPPTSSHSVRMASMAKVAGQPQNRYGREPRPATKYAVPMCRLIGSRPARTPDNNARRMVPKKRATILNTKCPTEIIVIAYKESHSA